MTSVAMYSEQPILTAGLQTVMAGLEDLTLSAAFTDLDPLMEHVQTRRPSVILVEVTAARPEPPFSSSHLAWRAKRSGSGDRSCRNGVIAGAHTPPSLFGVIFILCGAGNFARSRLQPAPRPRK